MNTNTLTHHPPTRRLTVAADRLGSALSRHWLLVFNALSGLFSGLTVVAPLLMALGLERPARLLYIAYAPNCHQLPQRSYFLFGPHGIDTYSLEQILAWGGDPAHLRGFVGNAEIGFKMAMAHRTTAIFGALFVAGLAYALLRRRLPVLPLKWYPLFVAPIFLDGLSHMISEVTRLGFRVANTWAAWLTGGRFAPAFYTGTGIGSLNWLLRTLTGVLFGLGTVWVLYPLLDQAFGDSRRLSDARLIHAEVQHVTSEVEQR